METTYHLKQLLLQEFEPETLSEKRKENIIQYLESAKADYLFATGWIFRWHKHGMAEQYAG
jgi:predicted ATP-dependent endonuclease of OLD family